MSCPSLVIYQYVDPRRDVQQLISEGVGLVWESYKLDPYVQRLAEMVVMFQVRITSNSELSKLI